VLFCHFYICEQSKNLNAGRASDLYHGISNHIYYLLRWRYIIQDVCGRTYACNFKGKALKCVRPYECNLEMY